MSDFLINEFYNRIKNVNLNIYGILDANNQIHTLGTDSKILGRIFEMITQPILEGIAKDYNLILETPKSQNTYPDFILMKDKLSKDKIAIDIKTTYITSPKSTIKFTLGSYTSYMRNNTKNIEYDYTDFQKHYVIAFIYKRNDAAQESRMYHYNEREKIIFPYYDVSYFIQEKYKIAGEKPGSGNTENIGSFPTKNLDDLKYGKGPFSKLGQDIFDLYWKYYPKYRSLEKDYTSLQEFAKWFLNQSNPPALLHAYSYNDTLKKVKILLLKPSAEKNEKDEFYSRNGCCESLSVAEKNKSYQNKQK